MLSEGIKIAQAKALGWYRFPSPRPARLAEVQNEADVATASCASDGERGSGRAGTAPSSVEAIGVR
jgi:hypothetical protein